MVGRQVIETKGKAHSERGALSDLALHLNRTAVKPYQLLHKGKTNSGAFVCSAALPFDTDRNICEDIGQLWFGDSDASVFHEQRRVGTLRADLDAYASFQCELERIRDEIENDLLPTSRDQDRRVARVVDSPLLGAGRRARKPNGNSRQARPSAPKDRRAHSWPECARLPHARNQATC